MLSYPLYNEKFNQQYPNEWLLIGNPEYNNEKVTGGFVLYHSKDKKEVCYIGRDKTDGFSKISLIYTGILASNRRNGILKTKMRHYN